MRHFTFLILAAGFMTAGCSHETPKADAPAKPETKVVAPKVVEKVKAKAEPVKATADSDTKVECSVKGDERVLEVREKGQGCEFAYTKAGKEGIVASASHGTDYCTKALEKVREKLKGAGYECK